MNDFSTAPGRGTILPIGGAEDRSVGGAILRRFVEVCGGEGARIAIIPTASQLPDTGPSYRRSFLDLGADDPKVLPFADRSDASSEKWLRILRRAHGVFLTGGNQLRLATVLGGTPAAELLRELHLGGLHVAGTSAGAAILSEHMIAYGSEGAVPKGEAVALTPGIGLLEQVIVDQHFSQRDRLGRLLTAVSFNPRFIGLGLDEDTGALISPTGHIEVVGSGSVTVVDPSEIQYSSAHRTAPGEPLSLLNVRLHVLGPRATFDLVKRRAAIVPVANAV